MRNMEAMYADDQVLIGNLVLGRGRATLPAARTRRRTTRGRTRDDPLVRAYRYADDRGETVYRRLLDAPAAATVVSSPGQEDAQ